jgi:hypothetical protein
MFRQLAADRLLHPCLIRSYTYATCTFPFPYFASLRLRSRYSPIIVIGRVAFFLMNGMAWHGSDSATLQPPSLSSRT